MKDRGRMKTITKKWKTTGDVFTKQSLKTVGHSRDSDDVRRPVYGTA